MLGQRSLNPELTPIDPKIERTTRENLKIPVDFKSSDSDSDFDSDFVKMGD
jgi:hypothetical protein